MQPYLNIEDQIQPLVKPIYTPTLEEYRGIADVLKYAHQNIRSMELSGYFISICDILYDWFLQDSETRNYPTELSRSNIFINCSNVNHFQVSSLKDSFRVLNGMEETIKRISQAYPKCESVEKILHYFLSVMKIEIEHLVKCVQITSKQHIQKAYES